MTTIKPWSGRGTKEPGEFKAYCKQSRWVPLDEVLSWPAEEQPNTTTTKWDAKLKREVAIVECAFGTTDPAAFDEHMKHVHRRQTVYGEHENLCKDVRKGWRGPRLLEEGRPWVDPSRRKGHSFTQTCARCGLIAEVGDTLADETWWNEHQRFCVGEDQAVAS